MSDVRADRPQRARFVRSLLALLLAGGLTACDLGFVEPEANAPSARAARRAVTSGAAAQRTAVPLVDYYVPRSGLFATTSWWQAANAIHALIDLRTVTGVDPFGARLANTFELHRIFGFRSFFYDDDGWWALTWINAYDATGRTEYLDMARSIFADMVGGWDAVCGGGVWWTQARTYKNAVTNELFIAVAVALHLRTHGDRGAGSYIDWARRGWAWFEASGMINEDDMINDGLDSACENNRDVTWTYNQGILLGALVDLSQATRDARLLRRARTLADASIVRLADEHGVLREPCESGDCGSDGPIFKGVYVRNLAKLTVATADHRYRRFLLRSATSAWLNAVDADGNVGLRWSGPFDQADAARQTAALDLFVAARRVCSAGPGAPVQPGDVRCAGRFASERGRSAKARIERQPVFRRRAHE